MSAEGSDPTTSPASSLADSILPTPDQDFSSRRASLSPQVVSDMSSPPILDTEEVLKPEVKTHEIIIPPPTLTVRADVRPNPPRLIGRQPPISMSTPSTKRNLTSSAQNTQRAPAPPPIMLRRPTGKHGGPAEDIPLATGSSTSSGPASPNRSTTPRRVTNGGGLNISGLPTMTGSVEKEEEEKDQLPALPDLLPSPRRKFFLQSDAEGQPKSPAWQSFEVDHRLSPGSPSTRNRPRGSVEMPFSPLSPNSNDKRFDPTPQHGIHTRNLSLFFPSPGQQHGRLSVPATPNFLSPEETHRSVVPLPAGSEEKKPFAGNADWRFGQPTGENSLETPDEVKRGKRRGHHVCDHRNLPYCMLIFSTAQAFPFPQLLLFPRSHPDQCELACSITRRIAKTHRHAPTRPYAIAVHAFNRSWLPHSVASATVDQARIEEAAACFLWRHASASRYRPVGRRPVERLEMSRRCRLSDGIRCHRSGCRNL